MFFLLTVVSSIGAIVVDGRVYPSRNADQPATPQQQGQQQQQQQNQQQQAQQIQSQQQPALKTIVKTDMSSPPQVPPYVTPPTQYQGQMRPPTPTVTPPLGRSNRVSPIGAITHQVSDAPET